ncbi:hypothetical protein HWV62_45755, partial [Athelia sp. TMB]
SFAASVNDTLVFLAISYRLAADAGGERSWRARCKSIVSGKGLLRLSRALMQSGQKYYLATILLFFVNLAVVIAPSLPATDHILLIVPWVIFTNIMACCVFRGVALEMMESPASFDAGSSRIDAALGPEFPPPLNHPR